MLMREAQPHVTSCKQRVNKHLAVCTRRAAVGAKTRADGRMQENKRGIAGSVWCALRELYSVRDRDIASGIRVWGHG